MSMKKTTDGTTTSADAAIITPQSKTSCPVKDFSATDTVILLVLFIIIREYKNSFHALMKV